jgi:hypothetical protein
MAEGATYPSHLSRINAIIYSYIYHGYVNIVYGYSVTSARFVKEAPVQVIWVITELYSIQVSSLKVYHNSVSMVR